jgi:1-acyl-sn-glycerol-3-phosphate acyltransferase
MSRLEAGTSVRFIFESIKFINRIPVTIEGRENIVSRQAMFGINHMGVAEWPLAIRILPAHTLTVLRSETFNFPYIGPYLNYSDFISINRGEIDRNAIRKVSKELSNSHNILMFPEGTRGRDEENTRRALKPGWRYMIYMAASAIQNIDPVDPRGIPLIPMAIWGTEGIFGEIDEAGLSLNQRFRFEKQPIYAKIGKPFFLSPSVSLHNKELFRQATDDFMIAIRDMLPEKYHGFYAGKTSHFHPGDILK